ncbi:hypothetical protein GGS21DRAFT_490478 [Xylaria nigripes]|nr:hypothetical protein GGS21DRAFT_490478 [Xylaria nigripes]
MYANKNWSRQVCGQSLSELNITTKSGQQHEHQRLCQGKDATGQYIGVIGHCFLCDYTSSSPENPILLVKHYKTHDITINNSQNLRWLRLNYQGVLLPDVNLNGEWGSLYSRKLFFSCSPKLKKAQDLFQRSPWTSKRLMKEYLIDYRDKFHDIFNMIPIAFTMHVTVVHPQMIGSIWQALIKQSDQRHTDPILKPLLAQTQAMVATVEGTYGATWGSQAYHSNFNHLTERGTGLEPVNIDLHLPTAQLKAAIRSLPAMGYISMTVEMVFTKNGHIMPTATWNLLDLSTALTDIQWYSSHQTMWSGCGPERGYSVQN